MDHVTAIKLEDEAARIEKINRQYDMVAIYFTASKWCSCSRRKEELNEQNREGTTNHGVEIYRDADFICLINRNEDLTIKDVRV